MHINQPQFVLDNVFNKYVRVDGTFIYWRDCVLKKDMNHGEQGYMWVFEDGETFHSYMTPEQSDV